MIITRSFSAGREHRMRASINVPSSSIQLTPRTQRARTAASAERESFVQQWILGQDTADRDPLLPPPLPLSNDVLSAQSCTHRKYLFVRDAATAGSADPRLTSRSLLVVRRKNSLLGSGIVPRNPLLLMEIGRHMEEDGISGRAGSFLHLHGDSLPPDPAPAHVMAEGGEKAHWGSALPSKVFPLTYRSPGPKDKGRRRLRAADEVRT